MRKFSGKEYLTGYMYEDKLNLFNGPAHSGLKMSHSGKGADRSLNLHRRLAYRTFPDPSFTVDVSFKICCDGFREGRSSRGGDSNPLLNLRP